MPPVHYKNNADKGTQVSRRMIFVNPTGQRDNLGDSVLRRPYLAMLRQHGELHVLAADGTDYTSALELEPVDIAYSSRRRWLTAAMLAAVRGGAMFAINAGEIVTGKGYARRALWQVFLSTAMRARGGHVVALGVGVRDPEEAPAALRTLMRGVNLMSWRDPASAQGSRTGTVNPDWAFTTGTAPDVPGLSDRPYLALSFRGDRPAPSAAWLDSVKEWARVRELEPLVVVQVRRDGDLGRMIAEHLRCEVVEWPGDRNHRDHEAVVRSYYRICALVVSDRIHSLILGLSEGAVPAAESTISTDKAARVFAPVTSLPVAPIVGVTEFSARWELLMRERAALMRDLNSARGKLAELNAEVGRLLDEGDSSRLADRTTITIEAGEPVHRD